MPKYFLQVKLPHNNWVEREYLTKAQVEIETARILEQHYNITAPLNMSKDVFHNLIHRRQRVNGLLREFVFVKKMSLQPNQQTIERYDA